MSQTLDIAGQPLFFPPSLATDDAGVIVPRPLEELSAFAAQIAPDQLLPFLRRLINGTSKRKRQPRWAAVNRQPMQLAKICIERALREGIVEASGA
jgi:hypothetical protein